MSVDPFAPFKAAKREGWASFAPLAAFTGLAAASLVEFAAVAPGQRVLDVGCGTGVVAVTAARRGATVDGLDLAPALLTEACTNATLAGVAIPFTEGDAENLPYADASFDVVLSQFGHMFAPRPEIAIAEMLRVLRPGGRIAFSTWPPHLTVGRIFTLVAGYLPPPPGAAAPTQWGDPATVRARLGDRVTALEFDQDEMIVPALSPQHFAATMVLTAAPIKKVFDTLQDDPPRQATFRAELEAIAASFFFRNRIRQTFLMTRATKL
jgi:ubiquinone/menaquinone biosynthesis C-methylase UbiE